MDWELLWSGLAAGDRNGGPVRLATILYQSTEDDFDAQRVFDNYADWVLGEGFDMGPTMEEVVLLVGGGMNIEEATQAIHHISESGSAGIGPAHRSASLLTRSHKSEEEIIDLAQQEARLTHWDVLAGRVSAVSLLIAHHLFYETSFAEIEDRIHHLFYDIRLDQEKRTRGGFAPLVLQTAWSFLTTTDSPREALNSSIEYAGAANYCPILVGLWSACLYKEIPKDLLDHPNCPPNSASLLFL
jgi:hypothetical protein